jgi:hypothetical protein
MKLTIFDIIPGWVYAAALALVALGGGVIFGFAQIEIAGLEADNSALHEQIAHDRADRLQLVADHNFKVARLQADHAKQQQGIVDAYQTEKRELALRHSRDLDRVARVQYAAGEHAARDRATAASDPAACQRVADRNGTLYGLLDEGFKLVVESRKLLGDRDAEVKALKATIENDRAKVCPSGE